MVVLCHSQHKLPYFRVPACRPYRLWKLSVLVTECRDRSRFSPFWLWLPPCVDHEIKRLLDFMRSFSRVGSCWGFCLILSRRFTKSALRSWFWDKRCLIFVVLPMLFFLDHDGPLSFPSSKQTFFFCDGCLFSYLAQSW